MLALQIWSHAHCSASVLLGHRLKFGICNPQVIYLVRDVWRGLSAKGAGHILPGGDKGFQRSLKDLTLTRSAPRSCSNVSLIRCDLNCDVPLGVSGPDNCSGVRCGMLYISECCVMCRWDAQRGATVDNLVLLTFEEAEAHEASHLTTMQQSEPELFEKVSSAIRQIRVDLGLQSMYA